MKKLKYKASWPSTICPTSTRDEFTQATGLSTKPFFTVNQKLEKFVNYIHIILLVFHLIIYYHCCSTYTIWWNCKE